MKSKDELLAWVVARATDKQDVAVASKLVAAYTADCVREDRKDRREPSLFERIFGDSNTGWPT